MIHYMNVLIQARIEPAWSIVHYPSVDGLFKKDSLPHEPSISPNGSYWEFKENLAGEIYQDSLSQRYGHNTLHEMCLVWCGLMSFKIIGMQAHHRQRQTYRNIWRHT